MRLAATWGPGSLLGGSTMYWYYYGMTQDSHLSLPLSNVTTQEDLREGRGKSATKPQGNNIPFSIEKQVGVIKVL